MFKKKPEPPTVDVSGLPIRLGSFYHEERKEFRISEEDFIKHVLKQESGHIEKIVQGLDELHIYWYKISDPAQRKREEPK